MHYLFTSESVSEGHPDKIADQIADAILDAMLEQDPVTRICCEVFVTTDFVLVGGEVRSKAVVNIPEIVRLTIRNIGYTKEEYHFSADTVQIFVTLHQQSSDIAVGVDKADEMDQGAGDQGIIFGYATSETEDFMPATIFYSHKLVARLNEIRRNRNGIMPYLRPDCKSQVTMAYSKENKPLFVDTIVISTQHDDLVSDALYPSITDDRDMLMQLHNDIVEHVIKESIPSHLLKTETRILINPTGRFILGGPYADAGLTNRKIIIDTYGGRGSHGGGGMSGKDASKVDRSAAYLARYIAKNCVAAGISDEFTIQIAYAIGISKPVSVFVNTHGTSKVALTDNKIADILREIFDFRPRSIEIKFDLRKPIYNATAKYGHMGRKPYQMEIMNHYTRELSILNFFSWEKLDDVSLIKKKFNL